MPSNEGCLISGCALVKLDCIIIPTKKEISYETSYSLPHRQALLNSGCGMKNAIEHDIFFSIWAYDKLVLNQSFVCERGTESDRKFASVPHPIYSLKSIRRRGSKIYSQWLKRLM